MWTLDGRSTQNILLGIASLNYDSSIEALEEMNVEVSSYEAEMGRSGGGFIQMTHQVWNQYISWCRLRICPQRCHGFAAISCSR